MNGGKHIFRANKQAFAAALKNLKKIDEKPAKINVLRFYGDCLELCATNGQEGVKFSINAEKFSAEGPSDKELALSPMVINSFIVFLEMENDPKGVLIEIDKTKEEIKLLRSKDVFISGKYLKNNENLFLLKTPVYLDLINTNKSENTDNTSTLSIPLVNIEEILSVCSSVQNEFTALNFRYNEGLCVEMAELSQIIRYKVEISDCKAQTLHGSLFKLGLNSFKKIASVAGSTNNETEKQVYLTVPNQENRKIKAFTEDFTYICPQTLANSVSNQLDSIFDGFKTSNNYFALNTEDLNALLAITPLLDKQNAYALLEFDNTEKCIQIRNGCVSEVPFLLKRVLADMNYQAAKEAAKLRGLLFINNVASIEKYFKTYQKNNDYEDFEDIKIKFRVSADEKCPTILAYYVETENLQYSFAGGTIKKEV